MSRPAAQVVNHAVLLQGPALRDVYYLISIGIRDVSRRDGIAPSPRLRHLLDLIATAASGENDVSSAGHGDGRELSDLEESRQPLDRVTTKEAAVILNLSARQVRRLAAELGAYPGPILTFDRAAVEAHAHHRRQKATAA